MEILAELIKQALSTGLAERGSVCVEVNGGVPIYSLRDEECTATEAADYFDSY